MNITRGNQNKPPAPMPTPPANPMVSRPPAPAPEKRALSPEVEQHIMAWSNMQDENVRLREANDRLNREVALQRDLVNQKELMLEDERQRFKETDRIKDKYLRFAQEIYTRGDDLGTRLDDMVNGVKGQTITGIQLIKAIEEMRAQLTKMIMRAMDLAQQHEPDAAALNQAEDDIRKSLSVMREQGQTGEIGPS